MIVLSLPKDKFFFGGVRITEILANFSLGGKFFEFLKIKGLIQNFWIQP